MILVNVFVSDLVVLIDHSRQLANHSCLSAVRLLQDMVFQGPIEY
jgi:hypothetical protein